MRYPTAMSLVPWMDPSYQINIAQAAERNADFRRVLHTGERTQLVVMSIPPNGDIGAETHRHVEQLIFVQSGHGVAILGVEKRPVRAGDVVVVPPGVRHNLLNVANVPMKLYTVYSPPNHIDGRVHQTRADADADVADEEFGRRV